MTCRSFIENVEFLICQPDPAVFVYQCVISWCPVETRSSACLINSHVSVDARFSAPLLLEMVENQSKRVCHPDITCQGWCFRSSESLLVARSVLKRQNHCLPFSFGTHREHQPGLQKEAIVLSKLAACVSFLLCLAYSYRGPQDFSSFFLEQHEYTGKIFPKCHGK